MPPPCGVAAKPLAAHCSSFACSGARRERLASRVAPLTAGRFAVRARASGDGGSGRSAGGDLPGDIGGNGLLATLRGAAGGALVSAAAASCLLLGAPSTESVSSFLSGALTGGVPAAYADEEDRTEIAFASDTDASTVGANEAGSSSSAKSSDLQIVDEVWKVVDDNFLPARSDVGFDRDAWAKLRDAYVADPPKSRAEAYGKVREILRTLGDPFSRFVDPADFAPLLKYDISGVGLNIAEDAEDPERLKVLGLVLDSPAARAGVKQGDELVAVDGVSVRSRSAFQAVSLIQAAPGPDVAVTVRSEGSAAERVVKLRRSSSAQNPVSARLEGGNVGYIRLREFNALAEPNVARAVETLRSQGAESFVLDLRDNPGGLVQAGVEIARLFLPADTNVAYTEGRVVAGGVKGETEYATTAAARESSRAKGDTTSSGFFGARGSDDRGISIAAPSTRLKSIPSASTRSVNEPLVVLVNGRSASASEILTGALKDNCRATVAGSKTYGKGLIQSVYELSDGSGLVLTVGKYVTPGLNDIDRQGIEPDFAMFPGFDKAQQRLDGCRMPEKPAAK